MNRENMSFSSDLGPDVDAAIQKVLDAVAEAMDSLEAVERLVALVVLQLYIEGEKTVMDAETLEAYQQILEASSATVFPIIEEAANGEE
jgi:hypothetical protein